MDASIRQLLAAVNLVRKEENAKKHLYKAFKLLESAFKDSDGQERTQSCGSDLYVLAAEEAFKLNEMKIAETCLTMYFHGTPLTDQFLCRAYLCQADLLVSAAPESSTSLDSAVVYLLKAITFAKDKPRYHFIVYNASVMFWKMARPFMREGMRGILHTSLQHIVKALEEIDDKDYEWRSKLLILLVQSLVCAGKVKEAAKVSETAADFTLQHSKFQFKEVLRLQITHNLVEYAKLQKQVKSLPEYGVYLKVQKLKNELKQNNTPIQVNFRDKIQTMLEIISPKTHPKTPSSPARQARRESTSSSSTGMSLGSSSPTRRRQSRAPSKAVIMPVLTEEELSQMGKEIVKPLLLEMARLCGDQDEVDLSMQCLDYLTELCDSDTSLNLEIECLKCYLHVKKLGNKQHLYTKHSVDVRLFAIKKLDQTIQNAVRSASSNVIQSACVTQWNLCLPLLQVNLRKHVRRPLTLVALALENISSLLIKLRCQIHTELAKCEEDVEQVEASMKHLRKAIQLDQTGFYHHRLHTMLRRLELSTQLYKNPESPEDKAAVIIEQARKSADSGSIRMKRSLLVNAGLALAPDAFQYVLDSESEVKNVGRGSKLDMEIFRLGAKANQWKKCTKKAVGHLKRLGDENDRERVRLWADLAKVARSQEVWDVCRVASRFCLLYDDDRWVVNESNSENVMTARTENIASADGQNTEEISATEGGEQTLEQSGIVISNSDNDNMFQNRDLIRLLAEIHFINGESLIHLLQCEGFKLNEVPISPFKNNMETDYSFIDDANWISYVAWIKDLSQAATSSFLRAITLGVSLTEPWIVCSGTAYIWNYNNHLLHEKSYAELVTVFDSALQGLQTVGHSTEIVLLVRICNVIAQGLLKKWVPPKPTKNESPVSPSKTPVSKTSSRNKTPGKDKNAGNGNQTVTVDPDATDDLKRALEICEYALDATNGSVAMDIISTAVRQSILATWVLLKQMLQQQIGPGLGSEKEVLEDQKNMTMGLVALECHTVNSNGMMELTVPPLEEVTELIAKANWDDPSIELQVWVRLAHLCILAKETVLVAKCCSNALKFKNLVKERIGTANTPKHSNVVDCDMLCTAACIQGENTLTTVTSNPFARRQALASFVASAKFADMAGNYYRAMAACKRWWNACLPFMSTAIERELLQTPLRTLLHCITSTSLKNKDKTTDPAANKTTSLMGITVTGDETDTADFNTDNAVRAAMYGTYFETYTDKGLWEDALNAMDQAVHHMPRTKHRLLIFKHRIMVKAKLGRSVFADIAKFKEESEEYVAHMWHRVALSSHEKMQQIQSYQRAIESLHSEETQWKKVDYLSEMAAWLYCNEFSKDDAIHVLEWAVDILLNMKFEQIVKEEKTPKQKLKGKKAVSKTPASRGSEKTRDSKRESKKEEKSKPATAEKVKEDTNNADGDGSKAEDYVPVEKDVIIGLKTGDLELKINQLNSVRQLECLIRAHVMLATMAGRCSEDHKQYSLLAVGFVMRLWNIALTAAKPLIAQLPKLETPAEVKGQKGAASQPATTKDKGQKRTGDPTAMPDDIIEWAKFEVQEDVRRAFSFNQTETAISNVTINKPTLTVHYLQDLCNELCAIGYHHLASPVYSLIELIVQDIIKSNSWSQLIRIQQIKLCYDINLFDCAKYWESTIGDQYLPEEEQAAFLQEVELFLQHQKQVQHEEERIKGQSGQATSFGKEEKQEEVISVITLQGEQLGKLEMKKLWLEKAKALMELGYSQEPRKLLDQALKAAKFYKDKRTEGEISIALAKLALQEANYGQAIKYLQNAEALGGDECYWLNVIGLMIDAILQNPDVNEEDYDASVSVLRHALLTLELVRATRPTKTQTIGFAINNLKSKLALLKISLKLGRDFQIRESLYVEFSNLEEAESEIEKLHFIRELSKTYRKHAMDLLNIAKDGTSSAREAHSLLLSAIDILQNGVNVLKEACCNIKRTVDMKKASEFVLPIERELCDITMDYINLCLHAYDFYATENFSSKESQAKTGSLEHIVREYVGQNRQSSPIEAQWDVVCMNLPQIVISLISDTFCATTMLPEKRAYCLLLCGRCIRLLNKYCGDSVTAQWDIQKLNIMVKLSNESVVESKPSDQSLDAPKSSITSRIGSTKSRASTGSNLTIRQKTKLMENASRLVKEHNSSKSLMAQANEVLLQCLKLSLDLQLLEIIDAAALELVECNGQFDPALTSQYLALHQSAVSAMEMKTLIKNAQTDSSVSKLAALLHQMDSITKNATAPYMIRSTLGTWVSESLLKFSAWQRVQVSSKHLDILKDFPPTFNFVVLQHSKNGKCLYAAIMDKPTAAAASSESKGKGKDKQAPTAQISQAQVEMIPVDPNMLAILLEKVEDWGVRLMSLLLQSEYQRAQASMRLKMLQQLAVDGQSEHATESTTALEEQEEEELKIKEEFEQIMSELEDYLHPITSWLQEKLIKPITQQCENEINQGTEADPNAMETIVLLLDSQMLQLPIEALKCFQTPFIDCLCRDFSLQFSHHRWYVDPDEQAAMAEKKKNDSKNTPKGGAKDARKTPAAKVVPLNRELLPSCKAVSTNSFHYVVDPLDETAETETHKPMEIMNEVLQMYATTCTSSWTGLRGSNGVPSAGNWEETVNDCEAFLFFGMERFLANMMPSKVVGMNLETCELFIMLDKAQTNKSFRHQSKVDVDKRNFMLHLERPLQTVMLLSLVGANSICINQWHSTLEENAGKLHSIAKVILEEGRVVGKAIRGMLNPVLEKPKPPEPDPQEVAAAGKDGKGGKGAKGSKSDSRKGKRQTPEPVMETPEPQLTEEDIFQEKVETITPEPVQIQHSWSNLVLYGLPNVMVT